MIELKIEEGPLTGLDAEVVIVLGFEGAAPTSSAESLGQWASEIYTSGEFTGKPCESAVLPHPAGLKAKRLVLAGAGKRDKFDANEMRKAVGTAVRTLKGKSFRRIHLWLEQPEFAQAAVEGAILGDFEPDQLKTDPKKGEKRLESFTLAVPKASPELKGGAGAAAGSSPKPKTSAVN